MIIDATNSILGRITTIAAKKAMIGEKVIIVNCEEAIVTGKRKAVLAKYKKRREIGSVTKGPFYPRMPDRIVRRAVRGMLPYKQSKGINAFRRVMCYIGVPEELKNQKQETIKEASVEKLPNRNFVKVKEISRILGAKI